MDLKHEGNLTHHCWCEMEKTSLHAKEGGQLLGVIPADI